MIKTILAAASGGGSDAANIAASLALARAFDAHLDVLHVRPDPAALAVAMTTDVGSAAPTTALLDQLERDGKAREAKARDSFTKLCPAGGDTEFHVEIGEEPQWVVRYGVTADLIFAPRGAGEAAASRATLETALLETGRPLIIPAAAALPATFERIAIAWKATPPAARAVAAALPFLSRAREVAVLIVEEEAGQGEEAEPLVRNLARHGVSAKAQPLPAGKDGAAALLAAAAGNADLLVMGGYGHSRLREWVFGGFTERALAAAQLPVLMAH